MIRTLNIVLVATSVAALVGVYALKFSVEGTASTKSQLERTIQRQEADLSLLKADWAYLNQPGHVAPIVERHAAELGIAPIKPEQFGSMAGLPMRLPPPDTHALDSLFESLAEGVDPAGESIEEH